MYGDVNGDGVFNDDDASALINYLFGSGGEAPAGLTNADANGDGGVDISDAIHLMNILRGQGPFPGGASDRATAGSPSNIPNHLVGL